MPDGTPGGRRMQQVMEAMIRYFGNDTRRISHALTVHAFALMLGSHESLDAVGRKIIGYTALLHDIGIHEAERKYHSAAGVYQQIEGPPVARQILMDHGVSRPIIERVCYIIANHHSYHAIDRIDFQIVVEADFLVNFSEERMQPAAIESVCQNVFRTAAGRELVRVMFPGQGEPSRDGSFP